MGLGEFVKTAREAKGLRQVQLSKLARVPLATIRDLEQGRVKTVRLETARRLARTLGVSVDQMADAALESEIELAVAHTAPRNRQRQ